MDQAVLLYDADCGFCRWSAAKVMAWDRGGRIRAVAIQSPEADALLPGMSKEERLESWHLVTPEGRVYSAGAAAAPLARLLPAGTPIAAVASAFPGITDRIYRWVARNRDSLGRRLGAEACSVDPSKLGRPDD